MAAYAAAKSGIVRLVESFAEELKADGVRINAVLPSIIDTPQNRAAMPKADPSAWVSPGELAAAIDFLIGDDAGAVTGAALPGARPDVKTAPIAENCGTGRAMAREARRPVARLGGSR